MDLINYYSHGISKFDPEEADNGTSGPLGRPEGGNGGEPHSHGDDEDEDGAAPVKNPLEQFTQNLNQQAAEGKIDALIGREPELERTIRILCRRKKNNPLYVGEPGVGKTAIAEGLALRIYEKKVPSVLEERHGVLPRHGRAPRGHQVPRPVRRAPEGRAQGPREPPRRDPLHRRDPHHRRRGRDLGRLHGRFEHAQARPRVGPPPLHRKHHVLRVQSGLRTRPRAGAALPEDRGGRALGGRHHQDSRRARAPVREAPRGDLRRRGAQAPRPSSRPSTSTIACCPTRPST